MGYPTSDQSLQALGKYTDAEKYIWMIWMFVILLSSLAGNITVLVGSIKYKAIQLDKVTTTLISHTAVSDMALILTTIPTIISLTSDSLFYGKTLCAGIKWANGFFVRSSCLLVTAINCSKLASLLRPMHSNAWSANRGHKIAGIVWLFAAFFIGLSALASRSSKTIFAARILMCLPKLTGSTTWIWVNVEGFLSKLLPMVVVFVTTAWLVSMLFRRYAKYNQLQQGASSQKRSLNVQGIATVIGIAVAFILSYGPLYSMMVYRLSSGGTKKMAYYANVMRAFNYLLYVNCSCNFFIYTATVRSFNTFVFKRVIPALLPGLTRKQRDSEIHLTSPK